MLKEIVEDISEEISVPFSMKEAVERKLQAAYDEYVGRMNRDIRFLLRRNPRKVLGTLSKMMKAKSKEE